MKSRQRIDNQSYKAAFEESDDSSDLVSSFLIVRTINVKEVKWRRVKSGSNFTRFLSEFLLLSEPLKENFDQKKVKSFLNFTSIPFDYLFFSMSDNLYAYYRGILTRLFFKKFRAKRCYGNLVILSSKL